MKQVRRSAGKHSGFTKNISESEQTHLDSEPQTENMEPHHHPHVHHSKKWKDYLFEFLMLFLAVTAGFFRESAGTLC